jgi:hypothetical protein
MVHKGMRSEMIIATILTTSCNFDVFSPGAQQSKRSSGVSRKVTTQVRGSKQFAAVIKSEIEIEGLAPEKDRVIYHYAESLKERQNNTSAPTNFPRLPVRN